MENLLYARASGAVHLMGNFAPSLALYTSLSISRLRPKSATFTWKCSPTRQFRAARSLFGTGQWRCVRERMCLCMKVKERVCLSLCIYLSYNKSYNMEVLGEPEWALDYWVHPRHKSNPGTCMWQGALVHCVWRQVASSQFKDVVRDQGGQLCRHGMPRACRAFSQAHDIEASLPTGCRKSPVTFSICAHCS